MPSRLILLLWKLCTDGYRIRCNAVLQSPKKVCNEINAEIAKFWGGQQQEEKKTHWLNWLELTVKTGNRGGGG